jgi:hypothetical protein
MPNQDHNERSRGSSTVGGRYALPPSSTTAATRRAS